MGVSPRRARDITRTYRDFPVLEIDRKGVRLWRRESVLRWIDWHEGRGAGRPRKIGRESRDGLGLELRRMLAEHGASVAFVANGLGVPRAFVQSLVDGTVASVDWPSPSSLREIAALFGSHPARLLEPAGYANAARVERGTYGHDNRSTAAMARALREEMS